MPGTVPNRPAERADRHAAEQAGFALLFGAIYYLVAEFSLALSIRPENVAPFWLPNAFLLFALLLTPARRWWAYLLSTVPGMLLISYRLEIGWARELGFVASNWLETVIVVVLLRSYCERKFRLGNLREFLCYALAIGLGSCAGAVLGTAVAMIGNEGLNFSSTWRTWWLGDGLGLLIMGPPLITWWHTIRNPAAIWCDNWMEFLAIIVAVGGTAGAFFVLDVVQVTHDPTLLHLTLAPLVWAGIRLMLPMASIAVLVLALTATIGTAMDRGPFGVGMSASAMLQLQGFMAVSAFVTLLTSAIMSDYRKQNQFTQTLLDNLPVGLAVNSIEDGTAVYSNKLFETVYGWPVEELQNVSTFFERVHPDPCYRRRIQDQVMSDIASADPNRMVWDNVEITCRDGSKRFVVATNIPLWEQGLMISTVQDMTRRKAQEQELQETLDRLRALFDASPTAVIEIAPDTTVRNWNKSAERIFGWSEEEVVGKPLPTIVPGDEAALRDLMSGVLAGRAFHGIEVRRRHKDGTIIPISLSSGPIRDAAGKVVALVGANEDIRQRKRSEEELRSYQKRLLESEKFAAIGRVSSGIAHEINNPLASIRTSAELMKRALDNKDAFVASRDGPRLLRRVQKVLRNVDRCTEIVEGLLGFARRGVGDYQAIDVRKALRESLAAIRESARTKKSCIRTTSQAISIDDIVAWRRDSALLNRLPELDGNTQVLVRARPGQFEQVLRNLLENALAATSMEGPIVVSFHLTADGVEIAVADAGEGIAEESLPYICEPFYTTKQPGEGTGLGLYLSRRIVENCGGRLDCDSIRGQGTIMRIRIAVADTQV